MGDPSGPENKADTAELKADVKKEDFEAAPRILDVKIEFWLGIFMISFSLFQLYTSWVGGFQDLVQRSIHLAFVLPSALIMYPPFKRSLKRNKIPVF